MTLNDIGIYFIDTRLQQSTVCKPKDLMDAFGFSRSTAQRIFGIYRALNGQHLLLDPVTKSYLTLEGFSPLIESTKESETALKGFVSFVGKYADLSASDTLRI